MRIVPALAGLLLLLNAAPSSVAEFHPPPTMEEMLGAEVIAIGKFSVAADGTVGFDCERVLKGDEATAKRLASTVASRLAREDGLTFHSRAMAAPLVNIVSLADAEKPWIWFLSSVMDPDVQPVELEDGYRALLEKKKPGLWFRLLQGLDPDLRWQAMEELAAAPEEKLVERLNRLALEGEHDAAYMAIRVLDETGLLTADSDRIRQWTRAGGEPDPGSAPGQPPLPPWTQADELAFLLDQLTSQGQHGFIMESAGREVVERHLEPGFAEMKKRLAMDEVYNLGMVMDGMGYLCHPEVFDFLVGYVANLPLWHDTFHHGLRAIARQDTERSFDEIAKILERHFPTPASYPESTLRRAYSLMRDPRAAAALATLGGGEAELDLAAQKAQVLKDWPRRSREFWGWGRHYASAMYNFAGPARRTTAIGEVARRDPAWLAARALERMDSDWRAERQAAEEIFRQLTGRNFEYRAESLAGKRREPLEKLRAWWAANREKTREEWLLSYFREKGYPMERLWSPESIPVLSRSLDGDFTTHCLAVEQISVIRGKFFTTFPVNRSYRDQERMTLRVRAWLE